jgi:hypothetical protein
LPGEEGFLQVLGLGELTRGPRWCTAPDGGQVDGLVVVTDHPVVRQFFQIGGDPCDPVVAR